MFFQGSGLRRLFIHTRTLQLIYIILFVAIKQLKRCDGRTGAEQVFVLSLCVCTRLTLIAVTERSRSFSHGMFLTFLAMRKAVPSNPFRGLLFTGIVTSQLIQSCCVSPLRTLRRNACISCGLSKVVFLFADISLFFLATE